MKVFTPFITRIVRRALWSLVGLLLAFIMFMTGGAFTLYQIEQECEAAHVFSTQAEKFFYCDEIKIIIRRDGEMS